VTRGDPGAARFFQALGDPTRLALLEELRGGARNVGALVAALGCPQPKVSRHLRALREAGLVRDRREGRNVVYVLAASRGWPAAAGTWVARLARRATSEPAGTEAPAAAAVRPAAETAAREPQPPRPRRVPGGTLEAHLL
jgi:DNA-binding transcriptional ArsR family regulator